MTRAQLCYDERAYRAQCSRHFTYLVGLMPELVGALRYSRAQIIEQQTQNLRALLQHAVGKSPWHRKRLAGIDHANATADDLDRIPVMTKQDLINQWDEIVTQPGAKVEDAEAFLKNFTHHSYFLDDCVVITSGGSSGRPGVFLYDWHGWAINWGSMVRGLVPVIMQKLGKKPSAARVASVSVGVSPHGSSVIGKTFSSPDQPSLSFPLDRPIAEVVGGLNEAQPELLYCLSSALSILCREAQEGRLRITPSIIFCNSEMLPDEDRKRAQKIWNALVLTCWGASEAGGTFPCPSGDGGFHISEDLVILTPVDQNNVPVPEGEKSSAILVTNLFNKALPLIRYKIDDIFQLSPEQCVCGSQYKKVRKVHGRTFEIFYYGPVAVHPGVVETPIEESPGVVEYQIRQTRTGADVSIVSETPVDRAYLARSMERILKDIGVTGPVVQVTQVDKIERTTSAKLRRYIPLQPESLVLAD